MGEIEVQKITEEKIKLADTFLFNNYDDKYYVHKKNIHTDKVALLLDPRCHYRLRPIIVNHMKHLKDWNLYVIGTTESVNYIQLILPNVDFDFCIINEKNINARQITNILLNEKLYIDYLKSYEHILTFQVDSLMLKPFNYKIFNHDYIGAYDAMMKTENSISHVYNGGISYRKKSFMLKCIKNFNHEILSQKRMKLGYIVDDYYPEDFYLSMCLSLMNNGKLQDVEYNDECKLFLQSNIDMFQFEEKRKLLSNAMALHGYDKHTYRALSYDDMKYLIESNNDKYNDVHTKYVIVAKYNEDVTWIKSLFNDTWNVSIYDKSGNTYKNVGREAETFLRFILDKYDVLKENDTVVFLQGNPFPHIPKIELQKKLRSMHKDVTPLGSIIPQYGSDILIESDAIGRPHIYMHNSIPLPIEKMWLTIYPCEKKTRWKFVSGAQYMVKGKHILAFDKLHWKHLHDLVYTEVICAWTFERFWYEIFTLQNK